MPNRNTVLLTVAMISAPIVLAGSILYALGNNTLAKLYGEAPTVATHATGSPYASPGNYIILLLALVPLILAGLAVVLPPPPKQRHAIGLSMLTGLLSLLAAAVFVIATI